ncbi:hypothetical protein CC80DRAFT_187655 [Byssothecium circinans]|uniref:SMP domain-containing protein n=1 Tax=Byssothecium circinans TaxID=147558 RepID=A0A6A5TJL6_9PLEO|nr:hypothetical protein CC80DRAFT_187655 [Byssothecium circinans]
MSATETVKTSTHLKNVLDKLVQDPLSITTEDARRVSENFVARDEQSAKIISAVETLAVAAQDVHETMPTTTLGQAPNISLLAVVNDLKAAVDTNPQQVTTEILRTTQGIVSKMQRSLGQTNAPHPELEAELQAECAKIQPKVELGTVTKAEADRLHSLEARAHGHTEKGGLTSVAQSVAAKRERTLSLSDSRPELETELQEESAKVQPKVEQETVSKAEADRLHSLEARAHGHTEKGGLTAAAQSVAAKRERLSDGTNQSTVEDSKTGPVAEVVIKDTVGGPLSVVPEKSEKA